MTKKNLLYFLCLISLYQLYGMDQSSSSASSAPDTSSDAALAHSMQENDLVHLMREEGMARLIIQEEREGMEEEIRPRNVRSSRGNIPIQSLIGKSLADLIQNNNMILWADEGKIKKDTLEYAKWISRFAQIKFKKLPDRRLICDIGLTRTNEKLKFFTHENEFNMNFCTDYNNYKKLPWYKRYKSHLAVGTAAFCAGILSALALKKFIK